MEFASVVIWRTYISFHTLPGNKQIELAIRQVFVPTALMISSFLALLASVLLIIDIHIASKATGKMLKCLNKNIDPTVKLDCYILHPSNSNKNKRKMFIKKTKVLLILSKRQGIE